MDKRPFLSEPDPACWNFDQPASTAIHRCHLIHPRRASARTNVRFAQHASRTCYTMSAPIAAAASNQGPSDRRRIGEVKTTSARTQRARRSGIGRLIPPPIAHLSPRSKLSHPNNGSHSLKDDAKKWSPESSRPGYVTGAQPKPFVRRPMHLPRRHRIPLTLRARR